MLASVMFPAWTWIDWPGRKFVASSFDLDLALRDARKHRALVESEWYRRRWPLTMKRELVRKASEFDNTAGGSRFSCSVGGKGTGRHGNILIIDDPVKALNIEGRFEVRAADLQRCINWWKSTMAVRFAHRSVVLIMQRLHERDLTGYFMQEGGWELLRLPMRYELQDARDDDPREEPGELLCPERFTEENVAEQEKTMGPRIAAAQLQQRTAAEGGDVFKTPYFGHTWRVLPDSGLWVQSWDMNFGGTTGRSFVVGQVWLAAYPNFHVVDQVRGRWDFDEICDQVRILTARWPKAVTKYVEDAAAGRPTVITLQKEIPGFELVRPVGSKRARAEATTGLWKAGNVLLPEDAPWVPDFEQEHENFTGADGEMNDQVDAGTQALLKLYTGGAASYSANLRKIRKML